MDVKYFKQTFHQNWYVFFFLIFFLKCQVNFDLLVLLLYLQRTTPPKPLN